MVKIMHARFFRFPIVYVKECSQSTFSRKNYLFPLLTGPTSLQVGYLTISPQNLVVEKVKSTVFIHL